MITYTGTGADLSVPHSFGISPSMVIIKQRKSLAYSFEGLVCTLKHYDAEVYDWAKSNNIPICESKMTFPNEELKLVFVMRFSNEEKEMDWMMYDTLRNTK